MIKDLISILPLSITPTSLWCSDKLPCHAAKINNTPIKDILDALNREEWVEGLFAYPEDLTQIKRYKEVDGQYKNDFDEKQFLQWIKTIQENTAICGMENKKVGKGVFVQPGKILPKFTFIPSSGIIKLNLTKQEFETKNHCSALQDLCSPERKIYGLIDPEKRGGILDLINHAPDEDEITHFTFKNSAIKKNVAIANLKSKIKFYNGYAIMGVEVIQDIEGGQYGKQLLWSYAKPDEYLSHHLAEFNQSMLVLFDNRDEHNGDIININHYSLREITIFLDTGDMMLRKVACLTRWELMESAPESGLIISIDDPYSSTQSESIQSSIVYGLLQTYLKQNPDANRVIIKMPTVDP